MHSDTEDTPFAPCTHPRGTQTQAATLTRVHCVRLCGQALRRSNALSLEAEEMAGAEEAAGTDEMERQRVRRMRTAVETYQRERAPAAEALARIVQVQPPPLPALANCCCHCQLLANCCHRPHPTLPQRPFLVRLPTGCWPRHCRLFANYSHLLTRALRDIAQVAFPYQYDQSFWRAKLFLGGFAIRLLLSKAARPIPLVRRLFAPPVAFGVLEGLEYVDVWRRGQRTTRVLQVAAAVLAVWLANILWFARFAHAAARLA